ncbi:MAG: hypothetical protein Q4D19_07060, partial [Lautropia sp.]|nr:hypothetical protein [Lautropia sp.]
RSASLSKARYFGSRSCSMTQSYKHLATNIPGSPHADGLITASGANHPEPYGTTAFSLQSFCQSVSGRFLVTFFWRLIARRFHRNKITNYDSGVCVPASGISDNPVHETGEISGISLRNPISQMPDGMK